MVVDVFKIKQNDFMQFSITFNLWCEIVKLKLYKNFRAQNKK